MVVTSFRSEIRWSGLTGFENKTQKKIQIIFIVNIEFKISHYINDCSSVCEVRSETFFLFPMAGRYMHIETVLSVILLSTIFTGIKESPRKMNRFDMINDIWLRISFYDMTLDT